VRLYLPNRSTTYAAKAEGWQVAGRKRGQAAGRERLRAQPSVLGGNHNDARLVQEARGWWQQAPPGNVLGYRHLTHLLRDDADDGVGRGGARRKG
jgi:hypothetical protein